MFDAKFFDDLSKKLAKSLPKGVQQACQDLEKNFHSVLKSALGKMDLVTRDEFDAQVDVLKRTRKKVDELEKRFGGGTKKSSPKSSGHKK